MAGGEPFEVMKDFATSTAEQYVYGDTIDLERICTQFSAVIVVSTTTGESASAWLQGSLDGVTWYSLDANVTVQPSAPTGTTTEMHTASGKPARYVRAAVYVYALVAGPVVSVTAIAD